MRTLQDILPPKQFNVVTYIARGLKNKEVAWAVGTTENVIKNYPRAIYDDVGLWNRVELALRFVQEAERGLYSCGHAIAPAPSLQLTSRQRQVVSLLLEGNENAMIAQELGMSLRTVKAYMDHLFHRLEIVRGIKRVKLATRFYLYQYRQGIYMVERSVLFQAHPFRQYSVEGGIA